MIANHHSHNASRDIQIMYLHLSQGMQEPIRVTVLPRILRRALLQIRLLALKKSLTPWMFNRRVAGKEAFIYICKVDVAKDC